MERPVLKKRPQIAVMSNDEKKRLAMMKVQCSSAVQRGVARGADEEDDDAPQTHPQKA